MAKNQSTFLHIYYIINSRYIKTEILYYYRRICNNNVYKHKKIEMLIYLLRVKKSMLNLEGILYLSTYLYNTYIAPSTLSHNITQLMYLTTLKFRFHL